MSLFVINESIKAIETSLGVQRWREIQIQENTMSVEQPPPQEEEVKVEKRSALVPISFDEPEPLNISPSPQKKLFSFNKIPVDVYILGKETAFHPFLKMMDDADDFDFDFYGFNESNHRPDAVVVIVIFDPTDRIRDSLRNNPPKIMENPLSTKPILVVEKPLNITQSYKNPPTFEEYAKAFFVSMKNDFSVINNPHNVETAKELSRSLRNPLPSDTAKKEEAPASKSFHTGEIPVDVYIQGAISSSDQILQKVDNGKFHFIKRNINDDSHTPGARVIIVVTSANFPSNADGYVPAHIPSRPDFEFKPILIIQRFLGTPKNFPTIEDKRYAGIMSVVVDFGLKLEGDVQHNKEMAKKISHLLQHPIEVEKPLTVVQIPPQTQTQNSIDFSVKLERMWSTFKNFDSPDLDFVTTQHSLSPLWFRLSVMHYEDYDKLVGESFRKTKKLVLLFGRKTKLEAAWFDENGAVWALHYAKNKKLAEDMGEMIHPCLQSGTETMKTLIAFAAMARLNSLHLTDASIVSSFKLTHLALIRIATGKLTFYQGVGFVPDSQKNEEIFEKLKQSTLLKPDFIHEAKKFVAGKDLENQDCRELDEMFKKSFTGEERRDLDRMHWKKELSPEDAKEWLAKYM
jgi:hypothetical protein